MNLAVQAIIKCIGEPPDELEVVPRYQGLVMEPADEAFQTLADAIERRPLNIIRSFFRALKRNSRAVTSLFDCMDKYNETLGPNAKEKDKVNKLKPILDSRTRWDSTYMLVERALEYRRGNVCTRGRLLIAAFDVISQVLDSFFKRPENTEYAVYRLSALEWLVLEDVQEILEVRCHSFLIRPQSQH